MKKFTLISLAFFLLSVSIQAQTETEASSQISVVGTGTVQIPPDEIVVSVGIKIRDKSVDKVSEETNSRSEAVVDALKQEGVDQEDIEVSYVTLQPYYSSSSENSTEESAPDFYIGQQALSFTLTNSTNINSIMTHLYAAGITDVKSVTFQIADDAVEEYKFQAREKAAANAKRIAESLTKALGVKLGDISTISESTSGGDSNVYYGYSPSYSYDSSDYSSLGSSYDPAIAGQLIEITSTVSVTYYLGALWRG